VSGDKVFVKTVLNAGIIRRGFAVRRERTNNHKSQNHRQSSGERKGYNTAYHKNTPFLNNDV
jgi:hypothetical protein